jgi:oligopeptide/dipeptide ABC transporter ATP-binding protein
LTESGSFTYAEPIVRALDVGVTFRHDRDRSVHALEHFSLQVFAGEGVALLGGRGAGKSVAMNVLFGRDSADTGAVQFLGNTLPWNAGAHQPTRHAMQLVAQVGDGVVAPALSALECVSEGLQLRHPLLRPSELVERALDWLARVGLARVNASRALSALSAGERTRVLVARALAFQPRLLGLDAPFTHVDASGRAQLANLLLDVHGQQIEAQQSQRNPSDQTFGMIVASQQLDWVRLVSNRFLVLYLGRVVETGPIALLDAGPAHPYTRALLGAQLRVAAPRRKLRIVLEGVTPDPMVAPSGCHFHPRCPRAVRGRCDTDTPLLEPASELAGHSVACFFPHQ